MGSTHEASAEALLVEAIEIVSDDDRAAFLTANCAGNVLLQLEVESMVADYFAAEGLLEPPVDLESTQGNGSSREVASLIPKPRIANYRFLDPIGEGGMGVVYAADQLAPIKRPVAIKVIKPGLDSKQVIARFEGERQTLALMDHPNIARVIDGGTTDDGRLYFVMERVHGVPINQFCNTHELGLTAKLQLFVDVCLAVEHAHQKGIIHRDLKPSNLLVSTSDDGPVAKVIDFGIAKATTQTLTDSNFRTGFAQLIGTPSYMSPEQLEMNNLDVDTRSDVYSLGIVLYELLTGCRPFDGPTLTERNFNDIRRLVCEGEPPRPSARITTLVAQGDSTLQVPRPIDPCQFAKSLRREVDWIVLKALERDRALRYQSARELAEDIRRYLNDEPVEACPPSAVYRIRKIAKRHRIALISGATICTAVMFAAGVCVWQAGVAIAERKIANEEKIKANISFDHALGAVETMLQRVASDKLENAPEMTAVRRELYDDAIRFYHDLADERSGDPRVRLNLARTQNRAAELCFYQSQIQCGLDFVIPAIANLESLVAGHPNDPEFQSELGACLLTSSRLKVELGNFDEAILESRAAIDHLTQIADRERLAKALTWLGETHYRQNRCDPENLREAERWIRKAMPLCEAAYADTHENWMAFCWNNWFLARSLSEMGKPQEAFAFFDTAIDVATTVIAEERHLSTSTNYPGMIRYDFAKALEKRGDVEEALVTYRQGLSDTRAHFKRFPGLDFSTFYTSASAIAIARLSTDLEKTDELDELVAGLDPHTLVDLFVRASIYQQVGNRELAISDFERLAVQNPSVNISYLLGCLHHDRGDYERALPLLTAAAAGNENPSVHGRLAHLHFKQGRFEDSIKSFRQAITKQPHEVSVLNWVWIDGVLGCEDAGFRTAYRELYDDLVRQNEDHPAVYASRAALRIALNQIDSASNDLKRCYELLGQAERDEQLQPRSASTARILESLSRLSTAAERYRLVGRRGDAIETLDHAILVAESLSTRFPDEQDIERQLIHVLRDRGDMQMDAKQFTIALDDYSRCLDLSSDDAAIWSRRKDAFASLGQFDRVGEDLERSIGLMPNSHPKLYFELYLAGLVALKLGEDALYRDHCRQILDLADETHAEAVQYFACWTVALGSDSAPDCARAVALARLMIDSDPEQSTNQLCLGAIEMRAGHYEQALDCITEAIEGDTNALASAAYLEFFHTMTLHHLGRFAEAREVLERAQQLADRERSDEEHPPAWNRKLTLELLAQEANALITGQARDLP